MTKQEEILEGITGYVATDILSIPKSWIFQAMEQYAEWYTSQMPDVGGQGKRGEKINTNHSTAEQSDAAAIAPMQCYAPLPPNLCCSICGYFCNNYHHYNCWFEVDGGNGA